MKKVFICLLIAVLWICLHSNVFSQLIIIPAETQFPDPGADATDLYRHITKYKPYTSWSLWPGKGRLYNGTEPHGVLLTTYVNPAAYFSVRNKGGMDYDSIIVKENYTSDRKFDSLTVMYKIKGYNPSAGDWFWAKYDPYGLVLASGKVEACIKCHAEKKENDYIRTGEVNR
jgi:hypothetical protein